MTYRQADRRRRGGTGGLGGGTGGAGGGRGRGSRDREIGAGPRDMTTSNSGVFPHLDLECQCSCKLILTPQILRSGSAIVAMHVMSQ